MNILLVDDQKEIVNSLKNGINWSSLPVHQVYTACSSKEAKLVLVNFQVDVLITDIEMPEENGVALCQWVRQNIENIEIIFLTSHPDFKYAQWAIRLGSFDYILQPARYEDIEKVILKVRDTVEQKKKIHRLENTRDLVAEQRDTILDAILSKATRNKLEDANMIYQHFVEMQQVSFGQCQIYPLLVQIQRWKKITNVWDERLVRLVLSNVIEELFCEQQAKTAISCFDDKCYWISLILPSKSDTTLYQQHIDEFYRFINSQMDFYISIYATAQLQQGDFSDIFEQLRKRNVQNIDKKPGVFWEDFVETQKIPEDDFIQLAMAYVKKNLSKNILRTDVADYVHLSEEYFSRIFKAQTGITFKDFLLMEKMKSAQFQLENTRLSISIIASKVGFDSFSHFSKMFKKITNQTPQEYRKERQK